MAATPSTMVELGTPAPAFDLPDPQGNRHRLEDFANAKALVVMFICNHCPFVKHVQQGIADLARDYQGRGVAFIAINSNDIEKYPDDAPDKMRIEAQKAGYTFPYLFDEAQSVARAYSAACTPDFFVFDSDRRLAYRGQLDDSRPDSDIPVTGADMRAALDAILAGDRPDADQKPSMGCNIKWKPGNEPATVGSSS